MTDTPRVPLQGNVILSPTKPIIFNSEPNRVTIIATNSDAIVIIADDETDVDTSSS